MQVRSALYWNGTLSVVISDVAIPCGTVTWNMKGAGLSRSSLHIISERRERVSIVCVCVAGVLAQSGAVGYLGGWARLPDDPNACKP